MTITEAINKFDQHEELSNTYKEIEMGYNALLVLKELNRVLEDYRNEQWYSHINDRDNSAKYCEYLAVQRAFRLFRDTVAAYMIDDEDE